MFATRSHEQNAVSIFPSVLVRFVDGSLLGLVRTCNRLVGHLAKNMSRSSSREVRIRVAFLLWSMLVGEPSPKKERLKRHY